MVRVGPGYRVRVRVRANPNPNHLGDELRSARCPCRAAGARARDRRHEPRPQQDAEPVRAERAERACGEGVRLDRICVCGGPRPLPLLGSPLLLLKSQCAVGTRSSPAAWSGGIDRVRIFRAVGAVPTDPSTTHSTDERRGYEPRPPWRLEEKPPPELARAEEEQPHEERARGDGRLHVPRRAADERAARERRFAMHASR